MTSVAAVGGVVGGISGLCVISAVVLLLYCIFKKRKPENNENPTDCHSESEYFEAIDFSKIRRELQQTGNVAPFSLSEADRSKVTESVETAQVEYYNDAHMTSYIEGNNIDYYNTGVHKLHKNVCFSIGNNSKCNGFESNRSCILDNCDVDKVILDMKNNVQQDLADERSSWCVQNGRTDLRLESEFQGETYFILEKEKTTEYAYDVGQRNENNNGVNSTKTDMEFTEENREERGGHLSVNNTESCTSVQDQQDGDDDYTDNMYFVLEK